MKTIARYLNLSLTSIFLLSIFLSQTYAQVAITHDPDEPEPHESAMLEIRSNALGLLIPRLDFAARDALVKVAGLMIYQVDVVPGFYFCDGSTWHLLGSGGSGTQNDEIVDADGTTRVAVADDDYPKKIRFDMYGTEFFIMDSGRLEVLNTGQSIFIGEGAGKNDDFDDNRNIAIGHSALNANTNGDNNVAIGYKSLNSNTTGYDNVANGYQSLNSNETGYGNTAMGYNSLFSNATGNLNTAIGFSTLENNTAGTENTAVGSSSLSQNIDGEKNTAVGNISLKNNTSGDNNTAVGNNSLSENTEGDANTAIGNISLTKNTSGSNNTAVGNNSLSQNIDGNENTSVGNISLKNNTSGSNNTAVGYRALLENTTGDNNTAIGNNALRENTNGNQNTALGNAALQKSTTGLYNTGIGYKALFENTTGVANTAIGIRSLESNKEGYFNTGIGYLADVGSDSLFNATAVGSSAYVTKSHSIVLGAIAGENNAAIDVNVGIGTTSPDEKLHVVGQVKIEQLMKGSLSDSLLSWDPADSTLRLVHADSIMNGGRLKNAIEDADGDSRIRVEANPDEDIIRFDMAGIEYFRMDSGRLEVLNTGQSVFIGEGAGANDDLSIKQNTAVGYMSLHSNTIGSQNTASGASALDNNTTGDNNTAIGYSADVGSNNLTNATAVGAQSFVEQDNSLVLGSINGVNGATSDVNVGIGTTSPDEKLHVAGKVKVEEMDTLTSANMLMTVNPVDGTLSKVMYDSIRDLSYGSDNVSPENAVFVDNSGNIGIGTTTPNEKLHVAGKIKVEEIDLLSSANMLMTVNPSDSTLSKVMYDSIRDLSYASDNNSPNDAVFVSQSGYIGIGTTSPNEKLHVAGKIKIEELDQLASADELMTWNPADSTLSLISSDSISVITNSISDTDSDTRIQVEANHNEDIIRFDMAGTEFFEMDEGRLKVKNTGGSVFIGDSAGINDDLSDNKNVAIGNSALNLNTSGSWNTSVGVQSLSYNQTGQKNCAFGFQSLFKNTGGLNTAIGFDALRVNTSGSRNTSVGHESLKSNTTGGRNTAIGNWSMAANSTGDLNTTIGDNADVGASDLTNATAIGARAYVQADNCLVLGSINGVNGATNDVKVGIGVTSPGFLLEVNGTAAKPGGGEWTASSDKRLKQDIKPYQDGLKMILNINPVLFRYNAQSGYDTKTEYVGVIAQELREIAPYMVGTYELAGEEYLNVDASAMTYMLINAIKEQQKTIEYLKDELNQIDALKAENREMRTEIEKINKLIGLIAEK